MKNNKTNTPQEKTEHESVLDASDTTSKISIAQNVIRNKFEKACMNRIEHERDVNQSLKPIIADSLLTTTSANNEMQNDPNKLCVQLRLLINSSIATNADHTHEITTIIAKLRDLEIIE